MKFAAFTDLILITETEVAGSHWRAIVEAPFVAQDEFRNWNLMEISNETHTTELLDDAPIIAIVTWDGMSRFITIDARLMMLN